MRVVVNGEIYDPLSDIILVEFDEQDLENLRNTPDDYRRYMLMPHNTPEDYAQELMDRWRVALDLHDQNKVADFNAYTLGTEIGRLERQVAYLKKQIREAAVNEAIEGDCDE